MNSREQAIEALDAIKQVAEAITGMGGDYHVNKIANWAVKGLAALRSSDLAGKELNQAGGVLDCLVHLVSVCEAEPMSVAVEKQVGYSRAAIKVALSAHKGAEQGIVDAARELLRLKDEDARLTKIEKENPHNATAFLERGDYQRAKGPAWEALRAALAHPKEQGQGSLGDDGGVPASPSRAAGVPSGQEAGTGFAAPSPGNATLLGDGRLPNGDTLEMMANELWRGIDLVKSRNRKQAIALLDVLKGRMMNGHRSLRGEPRAKGPLDHGIEGCPFCADANCTSDHK